jgi:putative phosphoesterase
MEIAIVTDIHGNSWALESVLSDIKQRGINKIYDLGDSLYGPLNPKRTFELIEEWEIKSICGNQDRYIFENANENTDNETLKYVLTELNDNTIIWLKELPKTRKIDDEILLCHGTPFNDSEYLIEQIFPDYVGVKEYMVLDKMLEEINEKIICCGHSHCSRIIETYKKIIINPGSIGLPAYTDELPLPHKMENFSPMARYCILHLDRKLKIEQVSLPYNFENAAERAEKNNRLDWAKWIRTGVA